MRMLEYGASGSLVRQLQQALVEVGYDIDVDGDFGAATRNAVRDFQSNNDLDVDGVVGPNTWAALGFEGEAHDSGGGGGGRGMIEYGAKGRAVRELQQALVDAGYDIDVDGDFGSGTDEAVRDFQSNNGLDVDGVVGPNTWAALGF